MIIVYKIQMKIDIILINITIQIKKRNKFTISLYTIEKNYKVNTF